MLKEAIEMLMKEKNACNSLKSGQLLFEGLGEIEHRALLDVFTFRSEGRSITSLQISNWGD
ncbi:MULTISPECIES: competence pheromone ComX [Paenibacillus]|uniref:ComX pheromone n=1 Tax=Paenibacillus pabuli TaxID=1472 RepID=A0A855Y1Y8_9BACL|nr:MULTISPECIES: competence pheromone ComX [Paenibacillus]PWW42189.1 hypothetical protein DET56_104246 [Paenibacillus pabuli]PXW07577.1 hypothetical protein DEU73_105245 [Paenibacillus taichungensis]RAI94660.1 hypothetical protein DET54_107197 [Paenibacillus pabuli]